jgi:demethylmenaquinone methyltransferase/2-methoxy-6-polyprenyl-1,4-benzoquinol methylase
VFTSVASKYDLMNDLMSFGIHRLWKRHFVASSGVKRGARVLDLAGGTGDIAALLADRVGHEGEIVLGDINAEMLGVGRDRLTDRGLVGNLRYVRLNAEALPFPDGHFDAVTIAFGLRNVTDKAAALREMRRVLKPGGKRHGARILRSRRTAAAPALRHPLVRSPAAPRQAVRERRRRATSTWPSRSASTRTRKPSRP